MPLHTVEPRRLYRQIADQIAGLIAAEEFVPGARLPAERELAKLLGVSRTSVRGVIATRAGEGVAPTPAARQRDAQAVART